MFEREKAALIDQLRREGIRDERLLSLFEQIPREAFVPKDMPPDRIYENAAQEIGYRQTISQPYMVLAMVQALELSGSERVLEIGTGSGYQTAFLALLADQVFSIERLVELSVRAQAALASIDITDVRFSVGDGTKGWPTYAPFDRVVVSAATAEMPPALLDQLAEGGIAVAPIGPPHGQTLCRYRKRGDQVEVERMFECRFVPLISEEQTKDK